MQSFDPERDIELTELDMAEVLDHVARPASLARDNEAYALTVIGDSMYPRFRPGRRVIVSPRAPVSIGDDVVVQLKGGAGEGEFRERVSTVLIKELVRRSATFIELRQFNPDVTFRVEQDRVAAIHKVVGEVY
jgi:phage repressor protein C with HTH and peptisase S24 domain